MILKKYISESNLIMHKLLHNTKLVSKTYFCEKKKERCDAKGIRQRIPLF